MSKVSVTARQAVNADIGFYQLVQALVDRGESISDIAIYIDMNKDHLSNILENKIEHVPGCYYIRLEKMYGAIEVEVLGGVVNG